MLNSSVWEREMREDAHMQPASTFKQSVGPSTSAVNHAADADDGALHDAETISNN